jgi:Ran GTPase-activating protein (RanGAP) involved in mRNA processing and transport
MLQILGRLPVHLAVSIFAAAEGSLSESLENMPESFHPLALCAHFPSITRDGTLSLICGPALKYPPPPTLMKAIFTAAATFTSLRELHIGPLGSSNVTCGVVDSFRKTLCECKGLCAISVHGGRRDMGFISDSVLIAMARSLPGLPLLESFELNTAHRPGAGQLAPESIKELFEGIGMCSSLKMLTLTAIVHGERPVNQGSPLANMLVKLTNLQRLKLRGSLTASSLRDLVTLLKDSEGVSLTKLWELDASNNALGDEGSRALAAFLQRLPTLESLNISENDIAIHGAEVLALVFSGMTQLRVLNLMDNRIADEGAHALSRAWTGLTNMENLDISFCDISGDGSAVLATAFAKFSKLQQLNLNGCKLSARFWERRQAGNSYSGDDCAGARALGQALKQHSNLRNLSLMGTQLNSDAMCMLAPGLAEHKGLISLDLQFNVQLGSTGIEALARHVRDLTQLQCLRLSCFDVSTDASTEFALSLAGLTSLKRLGLLGFHTSEDGIIAVVSALSKLTLLEELQVMSVGMSAVAAHTLGRALLNTVHMKNLHMDNNPLKDAGAKALAPALASLKFLKWVTMASTEMTVHGASAIVAALDQHSSIERCTVSVGDAEAQAQLPLVLRRPWVLIY